MMVMFRHLLRCYNLHPPYLVCLSLYHHHRHLLFLLLTLLPPNVAREAAVRRGQDVERAVLGEYGSEGLERSLKRGRAEAEGDAATATTTVPGLTCAACGADVGAVEEEGGEDGVPVYVLWEVLPGEA